MIFEFFIVTVITENCKTGYLDGNLQSIKNNMTYPLRLIFKKVLKGRYKRINNHLFVYSYIIICILYN